MKPKLRFKNFNNDWINCTIKDVADVIGGGTPDTSNSKFWNGDINWFTPSEVGKSKYVSNSERKITELGVQKSSAKLLPIGAILLSSRATVGEASILEKNQACTNQGFQSLVAHKNIDTEFLYYLKDKYKKEMLNKAFGSTFLEISKSNIEKIKIKIPSIEEQTIISNFLSLLDKKIELQSKKIEDLKLFKLCTMKEIFTSSNANNLIKIKDIAKIEKGKQINGELLLEHGNYYMLNGGTNPSGYLNEYNRNENTITISEGGNSCGYVSFNRVKFWCGGHCYSVAPYNINNDYLYQILKHNEKAIMDLRVGSGLPNIQKKDIENFSLKIHNKEEQKNITIKLSKFDYKIQLEENYLYQLLDLKKGLMQSMFV